MFFVIESNVREEKRNPKEVVILSTEDEARAIDVAKGYSADKQVDVYVAKCEYRMLAECVVADKLFFQKNQSSTKKTEKI